MFTFLYISLSQVFVFGLPFLFTCNPPCVSFLVAPHLSYVFIYVLHSPSCLSLPLFLSLSRSFSLSVSSPVTVLCYPLCVSSFWLRVLSCSHVCFFHAMRFSLHLIVVPVLYWQSFCHGFGSFWPSILRHISFFPAFSPWLFSLLVFSVCIFPCSSSQSPSYRCVFCSPA